MKSKQYLKWIAAFTTMVILTGCTTEKEKKVMDEISPTSAASFNEIKYQVEPETFSLDIMEETEIIPVAEAMQKRTVENYIENENKLQWSYPDEKIDVAIEGKEEYIRVSISSQASEDNEFQWPVIAGDEYYLPLGEGKRIPAADVSWVSYFSGREVEVLQEFSMPFWASARDGYAIIYILEQPYRNSLQFSKDDSVNFTLNHSYPAIDPIKESSFRIYIRKDNPVEVAKVYRNYVIEQGGFVTLEEKAEDNPEVKKLYGAPHIYLAGEYILSPENINWKEFRKLLDSDVIKHVLSFAPKLESGQEMLQSMEEIRTQDYVSQYQKNIICRFITEAIKHKDFFKEELFKAQDAYLKEVSSKKEFNKSEVIQRNKHAIAAALPQVFQPVDSWMNKETVDLITELKESGIEQAWIGLNSWEQAYIKPELTKKAVEEGYLIGTYDSYHSIHKPGEEQWITAAFSDKALYENATVAGKDGTELSGFQGVGRLLNPTLSLPSVKQRVGEILENNKEFNSWFIDCDATGEVFDDYSKEHKTTQQQDVEARLERMKYIRDTYSMVIGSEGGNDFAASTIAFAHGIELKSFSWMDEDMKKNKESEYYIGKYYNATGGVAEHFSKRIPVKEELYTIFVNPAYDLPLFKLVYNDSVITTYHWDWSTFKIKGAVQDRMLREVLYNVPPLYHLDSTQWNIFKEDIVNHTKVWSEFSKQVINKEMTDFQMLTEDGSVQLCEYGGNITVAANFSDNSYSYGGKEIPAHALLVSRNGESEIYSPQISPENQ